MPSITSGRDATLLQLQYLTDSLGLRRNYLEDDCAQGKKASNPIVTHVAADELENLVKPCPRSLAMPVIRPDIEWYPSHDTYQARVARLAQSQCNRPKTVPEGFPVQVFSPRAWTGSDFSDLERYLVHLSPTDVDEIKAALEHFKSLDDDNGPDAVSRNTFPLPTLGRKLVDVARNVHQGTGFNVIRGLDPTDFSPLDNVLIYLGITSYIAEIRGCQDFDGRMIVHIKDIDKELPDASGRPSPYTNRAQPFHTDMCDILSIFHKSKASWSNRPLLYNFEGHGPGFFYSRRPLTGAPFSPHRQDVPAMTEEQAEAIDAVHFTAVKHQLVVKLKPGDIEIFNNMALFHARNGFADREQEPNAEARLIVHDNSEALSKSAVNGTRHMLRLWLRSADENLAWKTPEALADNHYQIYGDSEARKIGRWDVHRAPPINRILTKHFRCS